MRSYAFRMTPFIGHARRRRILAPFGWGVSVLRPGTAVLELWQQMAQSMSNARLELISVSDRFDEYLHILENLGDEVDLVCGTYPSGDHSPDFNVLPLGTIPLSFAVPSQDPLARQHAVDADELVGKRVRILKPGNPHLDAARALLAKRQDIVIVDVDDYELSTFNDCVEAGDLLVTTGQWTNIHPGLTCVPATWNLSIPVGIMYPKQPSEVVAQFIELARAFLQTS